MIVLDGEIELWINVLWQAAYDFHRRDNCEEWAAQDAEEWFCSNSTALGSFLWICNSLDLNPDYLRERLIAEAMPRKREGQLPEHLADDNPQHENEDQEHKERDPMPASLDTALPGLGIGERVAEINAVPPACNIALPMCIDAGPKASGSGRHANA
jgi:hypothetical protein